MPPPLEKSTTRLSSRDDSANCTIPPTNRSSADMAKHYLYKADILTAHRKIKGFTKGVSLESLPEDELMHSAVERQLIIGGEAAGKLNKEVTEKPQIIQHYRLVSWKNAREMEKLRHILVHQWWQNRNGQITSKMLKYLSALAYKL